MSALRKWLEPFSWEFVTAQNEALCQAKSAHHGATSEGYEAARALWEEERSRVLELFEAVELCRKCHRLGPFSNFNGNTFSAVARTGKGYLKSVGVSEIEEAKKKPKSGEGSL